MPGLNAPIVDQDEFIDEALERAHAIFDEGQSLQRAVRRGADVQVALDSRGPLYLYAESRRKAAMDAVLGLIEVDATDAVGVRTYQMRVREYLNLVGWVQDIIADSDQADRIIETMQSNGGEGYDDLE